MDVTISIINYNYGRFLSTAIDSALIQKYDNIEIELLIIDDGSTDESDSVIAKYSDNKRIRCSKTKNQGFAASLTRAIIEAKGDYVFLMDADDYFTEMKVNNMLPILIQGALFVCDTSSYVNEKGESIIGGMWGSTSTMGVNKMSVLSLLPVENELSFFSLYKLGKGIILHESYTCYRVHGKSMTDRKVPGKWETYLAKITHNLVMRLKDLANANLLPPWNLSSKKILSVAFEFEAEAYYHELEAALELKQVIEAYKKCMQMIFWSIRAGKGITIFHLKMFVKTVIMRPSKPK